MLFVDIKNNPEFIQMPKKARLKVVKCAYKPGTLTTFISNDDPTAWVNHKKNDL